MYIAYRNQYLHSISSDAWSDSRGCPAEMVNLFVSPFLLAIVCRWLAVGFLLHVHNLSNAIEWRLSHFLPHQFRAGWQSVTSQGNIPWNMAGNWTRATEWAYSEIDWTTITDMISLLLIDFWILPDRIFTASFSLVKDVMVCMMMSFTWFQPAQWVVTYASAAALCVRGGFITASLEAAMPFCDCSPAAANRWCFGYCQCGALDFSLTYWRQCGFKPWEGKSPILYQYPFLKEHWGKPLQPVQQIFFYLHMAISNIFMIFTNPMFLVLFIIRSSHCEISLLESFFLGFPFNNHFRHDQIKRNVKQWQISINAPPCSETCSPLS